MIHRYTHGHHESVLRSHSWRTAENSAGYLLPLLRPGMALLDIGCGPGTITADLASRVAPGPVTAVDAADAVLATARAETGRRGLGNVSFTVADTHHLPFPDDSFDVVHAHQVLQHVADPVRALREMRRVCRPGGHVAVRDSDYHGFVWHPQPPELTGWLDLYQRLARANGGEPDAGRRLLGWARAAGFEQVTASSSTWCFATEQDRRWWGGMWADRVRQSAFAAQAAEHGVDAGRLDRIAEAWRDWAESPEGWFSVLHGELLCRV